MYILPRVRLKPGFGSQNSLAIKNNKSHLDNMGFKKRFHSQIAGLDYFHVNLMLPLSIYLFTLVTT